MSDTQQSDSKVARVIESYNLDGLGDRLENEWIGATGERTSLRDLADIFNREVLEAALRSNGESPIQYDIESTYRVLTDDDVSSTDTLRKERDLERTGIDVEELRSDFVTHQAIYTYLTDYRGTKLEKQSPDPKQKVETLERLKGRTTAVAKSTLDELISANEVSNRDYMVFVEARTVCEECGTAYTLVDLIQQKGCDC